MSDNNKLFSDEIKLYQPLQEQILLTDLANCVSVQAFLRMCKLNYDVVYRQNAEDMSPSEELPLLKCNMFIVSGFDPIVQFFEKRGVSLTRNLEEFQKSEVQAYISFIRMVLANAENYITWKDEQTYGSVTKSRFSSVYPWPLSCYLYRQKKYKAIRKLDAQDWSDKTLEEVYEEVDTCCKALSRRLNRGYFVDQTPTDLDAVVFGHVYAILNSPISKNRFAAIIHGYPDIITYYEKVVNEYFDNELPNAFCT